MKKSIYGKMIAVSLAMIPLMIICGCAKEKTVEDSSDSSSLFEPIVRTEAGEEQDSNQQNASADESQSENGTSTLILRQDGERFEETIILEGMEETVKYEHVINTSIGFEIDYDYESFLRKSDSDRERFISIYDDTDNPENYLEIKYLQEDADTALKLINEDLSNDYEILTEAYTLDTGLSGTCIDASEAKGGAGTPDKLQTVYVFPAGGGSLVCTAHFGFESAEGFGRRFSYIVNTLVIIPREANGNLVDENIVDGNIVDENITDANITEDQAISAIQNYCYINNPDLENIVNEGEYTVYWDVSTDDEGEIVVLFRSYTGAILRYYINPMSGDTYVTEFVPGITDDEEQTDETFNVKDYMN